MRIWWLLLASGVCMGTVSSQDTCRQGHPGVPGNPGAAWERWTRRSKGDKGDIQVPTSCTFSCLHSFPLPLASSIHSSPVRSAPASSLIHHPPTSLHRLKPEREPAWPDPAWVAGYRGSTGHQNLSLPGFPAGWGCVPARQHLWYCRAVFRSK